MKKRLLLIINCLLLCCTVSFAWILSGNPELVTELRFDYTGSSHLVISSVNVDVEVFLLVDNQEVPMDESFELHSDMLIPNALIPFRIKFHYQSQNQSSLSVNLSLVGITVSDPALLNKVSISVTPITDGLVAPNGPHTIYTSLGNAVPSSDGASYTLNIYDNNNRLYIPHKEDGPSVLDCYLLMSKDADASFQDMWLSIQAFRVE